MNTIENFVNILFTKDLWEETFRVQKNVFLNEIGEVSDDLFFVKSGALIISAEIEEKEQVIRLAYSNSLFCCIDSFLFETPTIYRIKALKSTELLKVSKKSLQKFLNQNIDLYRDLMVELIRQQNERELDLLCTSAHLRYDRLLKRSPKIFQEIPHKYLASYLRISPETLSRLLKK